MPLASHGRRLLIAIHYLPISRAFRNMPWIVYDRGVGLVGAEAAMRSQFRHDFTLSIYVSARDRFYAWMRGSYTAASDGSVLLHFRQRTLPTPLSHCLGKKGRRK